MLVRTSVAISERLDRPVREHWLQTADGSAIMARSRKQRR
jgi:hypothetical protein